MVHLTLKEGKGYIPVAQIVSRDKLNNEVLFINPSLDDGDSDADFDYNLQEIDYGKYLHSMKPREAVMVQNTCRRNFHL